MGISKSEQARGSGPARPSNYLRGLEWVLERLGVSEVELNALIREGVLSAPVATRNADGIALFDGLEVHELSKQIKRKKVQREHAALVRELVS